MKKIIIALMVLLAVNVAFAKHVCYVNKADSLFYINNSGDAGYEEAMTIAYYKKNCHYEATISNNQNILSIRKFCNDDLLESTFMMKNYGEESYYYSYKEFDQFGIIIDRHETDLSLTTIGREWSDFTNNCRKYIEIE